MKWRRVFLILFCHSLICSVVTDVSTLRSKLLKEYSKDVRPVKDHKSNTTVKFGISLLNVNLNDHHQSMEISSILHLTWNDEFLRWDEQTEGVDRLHFDREEIWVPDVALFNSAQGSNTSPRSSIPMLVLNTGTVLWLPPFTAEVPCQISLFSWPQDINTCSFRFGSWAHHGDQLDVQPADWVNNSISLSKYEQSNKWKLYNYSTQRQMTEFEGDKFIHIDFKITVQREAAAHVSYVTHTAMAIMMCILSSYFLPLRFHLSRVIIHLFGLTVLIICDVVLYLSLPATGGRIPHIVRYYSGTIILTTMSLICNVIMITTMSLSSKDDSKEIQRRPIAGSSQEINYVVLEEELSEIPRRNEIPAGDSILDSQLEGPNGSASSRNMEQEHRSSLHTKGLTSKYNMHKALNMLFLGMYSVAYIIDYIVMKSSISGR